ncbi:hypothetical protein GXM_06830 [Nostoc sphaeroides CCNUC1]|uniref:Uncharacterized protein n=1 Tax=Nostoc sphaeroides CCNUC1 TaxID=2653204 RepID=A0A5P8WAY5_9NOSO|nr:hypothetical protein GXM_06830 [Nostoc sphaeroides CCNUC1]
MLFDSGKIVNTERYILDHLSWNFRVVMNLKALICNCF